MDDRHARHRRRPADRRRRPVPGYRSAGETGFDRAVTEALRSLPAAVLDHLRGVELRVAELPPAGAVDAVLLSRYREPSPERGRLSLYRRPLEARARDRAELVELIREVVLREVADQLGLDDDDLDDRGWR